MGPSIGGICILCQHVARRTFFAAFLRGDKRLLFIWIGFLSCAYIMGEDKHMRVTTIVERLPQRVRAVIRIIMDVIMIVVFLVRSAAVLQADGQGDLFRPAPPAAQIHCWPPVLRFSGSGKNVTCSSRRCSGREHSTRYRDTCRSSRSLPGRRSAAECG